MLNLLTHRSLTRLLSMLAAVAIASVSMTGCSGNSSPVGTWTLDAESTKVAFDKAIEEQVEAGTMNAESAKMAKGMVTMISSMGVSLEFKADGTVSLAMSMPNGDSRESRTGTWEAKGNALTINLSGEDSAGNAYLNGDTLTLEGKENKPSMMFKRT
jgi:hypothetical protein